MSAAEIAVDLKATFPKVLYWIKKHGIPIRSCSERTYVKLNPSGDPFHPKEHLTPMDHRMLVLFIRFLREIVRADESRLRLDVRVYHGFDKDKARRYWCRALGLKPKQVFVCPHIDHRSDPNKQWSPYGIATACVSNTKLKVWMDQQLEENIVRLLDQEVSSGTVVGKNDCGVVRDGNATYTYL